MILILAKLNQTLCEKLLTGVIEKPRVIGKSYVCGCLLPEGGHVMVYSRVRRMTADPVAS